MGLRDIINGDEQPQREGRESECLIYCDESGCMEKPMAGYDYCQTHQAIRDGIESLTGTCETPITLGRKFCAACDGSGEIRDEANADAEVVDDPPRTIDNTPMIDCPTCKGTGFTSPDSMSKEFSR